MKKMTRILTLLLICILLIGVSTADAQYYGKKKKKKKKKPAKTEQVEEKTKDTTTKEDTDDYFDESGGFKHKLWYGGGVNLGFSGNQSISVFNFGVSPMVGYKITDKFSVGPRIALQYNYYKGYGNDGRIHKVQPLSYSAGVFTRYKILNVLFAHGEFEFQNDEVVYVDSRQQFIIDNTEGEVWTERETRNNAYLGVGYNSGGLLAYEIYLLYNVLEPANSQNLPFSIRAGVTYKF